MKYKEFNMTCVIRSGICCLLFLCSNPLKRYSFEIYGRDLVHGKRIVFLSIKFAVCL